MGGFTKITIVVEYSGKCCSFPSREPRCWILYEKIPMRTHSRAFIYTFYSRTIFFYYSIFFIHWKCVFHLEKKMFHRITCLLVSYNYVLLGVYNTINSYINKWIIFNLFRLRDSENSVISWRQRQVSQVHNPLDYCSVTLCGVVSLTFIQ